MLLYSRGLDKSFNMGFNVSGWLLWKNKQVSPVLVCFFGVNGVPGRSA